MSNEIIFDILPFDPLIVPNRYVQLPIEVDDLARRLQVKLPEVDVERLHGSIRVYIQTEKYGPRVIAQFLESLASSVFLVGPTGLRGI